MTMEYTAHGLMFTAHPLHPHYHYEARVRAETISPGPYTSGSVQTQLNEAGMTAVIERRVMQLFNLYSGIATALHPHNNYYVAVTGVVIEIETAIIKDCQ